MSRLVQLTDDTYLDTCVPCRCVCVKVLTCVCYHINHHFCFCYYFSIRTRIDYRRFTSRNLTTFELVDAAFFWTFEFFRCVQKCSFTTRFRSKSKSEFFSTTIFSDTHILFCHRMFVCLDFNDVEC